MLSPIYAISILPKSVLYYKPSSFHISIHEVHMHGMLGGVLHITHIYNGIQRDQVTCRKSHSYSVIKVVFDPGLSDFHYPIQPPFKKYLPKGVMFDLT